MKRLLMITSLLMIVLAGCGFEDDGASDTTSAETEAAAETEAPAETTVAEETEAPADTEAEEPAETTAPTETTGGDAATGEPIVIGHVADFSDIYSFYDSPIRQGAEYAVEEINADGGILGRPVELLTQDGRNNQEETLRSTQEAVDAGAAYLIGTTSDPFLAQATLACGAGLPISTGDGTAPTLVGDAGDCAYQTIMSDNLQGAVAADYALAEGYETAVTVGSSDVAYTADLPTYFADAFEGGGGEIVAEEQFSVGAGDFEVQVTAISGLDPAPDVIFTPMFIPDTPVFLRQLRQAGVDIPVISTDGSVDPAILEAGDAVEGMVATTHAWPTEDNALGEFFARFEEDTGTAPESVVTGIGYDEMYIIKQVIEEAGSTDPEAIMSALDALEFEGVTGSLTMNPETRRADKEITLVEVVDGEINFLSQSVPEMIPEVR